MDLFIHIYKKNYSKFFNKAQINRFEKTCFICFRAMLFLVLAAFILQKIFDSILFGLIVIGIIIIWTTVLISISYKKKKKEKDAIVLHDYENRIKALKTTFKERQITWSKENLNLLFNQCENKLNYKNPYFEMFKKIYAIAIIPLLTTYFLELSIILIEPNFKVSIGILFIALFMISILFIACPLWYSIIYKHNTFYQIITDTILDYRLSNEYEEIKLN